MKPSHRVFVNEFLRSGDQVKAYQKAYPNVSENAARSAANRLLQDPEISGVVNNIYNDIKEEVMAEFRDRMVELYDLKVYLSQLIRGELQTEREVNSKNGPVTLHQSPGFTQILRAADMLAKIEGWYKLSAKKESGERGEGADGRRLEEFLSAEKQGEERGEGAEGLQILTLGEMDSLRKELLLIGKEHETYLQEIKDEGGILADLFAALDEENGLGHFDEMDLLELQAEVETRLLNREQEQGQVAEVTPETEPQDAEKENKNIDSLQQITTKTFADTSGSSNCDFTTKPQKTIRIARRNK